LSDPVTKDERDEDEPVVNDASSLPPAGGDASDTGVFDAGDALDVTGVAVEAGTATVLAVDTASVPMAVRMPANVPSEISMVNIQEVRCFLFIPDSVSGVISRR